MRLLSVHTLKVTEFGQDVPPYAILSHTWGNKEISFVEIQEGTGIDLEGYRKVFECCRQARHDGLDFVVSSAILHISRKKTGQAVINPRAVDRYMLHRQAELC